MNGEAEFIFTFSPCPLLTFVQAEHEICKPQLRLGDRERDEDAWCLQEFEERELVLNFPLLPSPFH